MKKVLTCWIGVPAAVALLAACGGGGGGGGSATSSALSTTQSNFEKQVIKDSYVTFDYSIPSAYNSAPVPGTHFIATNTNSALSSPSAGPQLNTDANTNLSTTLSLPDYSKISVTRALKNGVIYARNSNSKQTWSFQGNDVLLTSYASDGITPLGTTVYDEWSAPIPLSGKISDTSILKSFIGFTRRTTDTLNFDFNQSWLEGAAYFTRKGYHLADTIFVYDGKAPTTYDKDVTPMSSSAATIEDLFAESGTGSLTFDKQAYVITDGTITTVEGARTWIAKNPRPTNLHPTDEYTVLIELSGRVYVGGLVKAGTRQKSIDGADQTTVLDYAIRLNSKAADSIKQTIKF